MNPNYSGMHETRRGADTPKKVPYANYDYTV